MNGNLEKQKRIQILKRHGVATGALGAVALATTQANALDVGGATSGSSAQTDIETGAVWVLGIAVVIFSARKVIGFFRG
ncbi:putative membrane protein [Acinetobacter sp. 1294596]|uniref:hypothetical protein n=1 Tax=Acinetobacter sp. 1294596 TaxID=1310603 RepID=UPI00044CAE06|nr:hypothetical protein [Acinetobacter sp. 1294596]EXF55955.1 putative membrane protein [Acinetobacter sp. 1294596]